ncbi:hypothetical protein NLU13_9163 [Sarocladium strictum]|uniref:Low temperature requirement A n=1 Tax=Sarocladium strictum TaxID=5046 RepID=A0AA39G9M5_SARSR|nr:hypothetical protein NLU13_9163 [Sarocladium strictum]
MAQNEKLVGSAVEKLKFISSPLHPDATGRSAPSLEATASNGVSSSSTQRSLDEIRLAHNDDATNLEIFYDLFLACINLFSQNQQLTTLRGLSAYCGFFGIIWTTWFMTGMYDVRFLKDSIFERLARGVHLGVLVGFVVVSPNFDTQDQDPVVFKTFTIILMVSRLCLAAEYGSVLYHLRAFRDARLPVGLLVVKNGLAAIIYLAVSFRFREGHNSTIFSVWYILAGVEIIGVIFLSWKYRFLSFHGTYIMKRIGLLTCILFGEGVASACGSVTKVIKVEEHVEVWTSQTIGTVTACVTLMYIVYMVYSDWVSKVQLPGWRQMAWVLLHFPLHLVMMLFMEGCSQFIIFWKLSEKSIWMIGQFVPLWEGIMDDPQRFVAGMNDLVTEFVKKFPPVYTALYTALEDALATIDDFDYDETFDRWWNMTSEAEIEKDKGYRELYGALESIILTLDNTLYNKYGIDYTEDVVNSEGLTDDGQLDVLQMTINNRSYGRFRVVFQYTFACAGFFLGLANLLSIISRTKRWTWSATTYHLAIFLLALGISLVAAVSQNDEYLMNYQFTPWILPTLLFAYILILATNHVSGWLAASRDKKETRKADMEARDRSGDSITFGSNGQPNTTLGTDKTPMYSYVPEDDQRTSHPDTPAEGVLSVPRRPVPYSSANYASDNAV